MTRKHDTPTEREAGTDAIVAAHRGPVLAFTPTSDAATTGVVPDSRPHMFSLFGWTPALRRMLRSSILPCGCSVGVYETFSGEVVRILDACSDTCGNAVHSVDAVLAAEPEPDDADPQPRGVGPGAAP
jgi:hypothetical protein